MQSEILNSTTISLAEQEDEVKSENAKENKQHDNPSKNLINKPTNLTSYPATHTRQVTSQKRWDVVYDYRGSACCSGPGYCHKLKECGVNGCKDTSPYHFIMKSTSKRRSR